MNDWIITFEILIILALTTILGLAVILMPPNWFLRIFVHKQNSSKHFPVENYTGMTVTGYTCHGCGYEWYKKRKREK